MTPTIENKKIEPKYFLQKYYNLDELINFCVWKENEWTSNFSGGYIGDGVDSADIIKESRDRYTEIFYSQDFDKHIRTQTKRKISMSNIYDIALKYCIQQGLY